MHGKSKDVFDVNCPSERTAIPRRVIIYIVADEAGKKNFNNGIYIYKYIPTENQRGSLAVRLDSLNRKHASTMQ